MAKQLTEWLDEFVNNGANPNDVPNWPEEKGGSTQSDWGQTDSTKPDFIKNKELVTDLIKSDAEGNVYINSGFVNQYTLAAEYDPTVTYYEAYIPLDPTKLTGTWVPDETTIPVEYVTTFTEGQALIYSRSIWKLEYIDSFKHHDNYTILITTHYYEDGQKKTSWMPMYWDNWNIDNIAFNAELPETYNFIQSYFIKRSDTPLSAELPTLADVLAYDQSHPSYRVIELTEQTFVPNTYYTLQNNPTWVNVKDLINNGN